MKKVSLMIAALALVLGLSQCKKQEKPVANGEKQHIVLTANNGNDGSKVAGEFVADALNLTWQDGDVIDVKGGASGTLTLVDGAGTTSATFEGDIEKGSGETIEFTVGNEPSYLSQTGADRYITDSIYLVGTSQYKEDGNYSVDMKLPHAVLKLNVSALGASGALTISVGTSKVASVESVTDPSEVFVAVPADGSQKNYTIGFGGKTATKEWTLAANVFYTKNGSTTGEAIVIEPDAPTAPEGALSGLFTVGIGDDGQAGTNDDVKVWFSKGNLQYHTTNKTWRFANSQYALLDNDGSNYAENSGKWIDLFGWGTSGNNHNNGCYQPWSTNTTNSQYYAYCDSNYDLYDGEGEMKGKADWGANAISNGGGSTWRTLTGGSNGEWNYLINIREVNGETGYGHTCVQATVEGVYGLIIFHDGYTGTTSGLTSIPEGCVFLPAAGYREGTSANNVGSNGYYWSSSHETSSYAYYLYFSSSSVNPSYSNYRSNGYSVRLVSVK